MSDAGRPSIRRNALARLTALLIRVVLSTASAVVTARALGPDGKGTLSSLLYTAALLSYGSSLGLGDAATVLAGSGRVELRRAFASSIVPMLVAATAAIGVLAVVREIAQWQGITGAVGLAAGVVVTSAFVYSMTVFVEATEDLTFTAIVSVIGGVVTLVVTAGLVGPLNAGVPGGIAGTLIGGSVMVVLLANGMRRRGFELRPALNRAFLRPALRLGIVLQGTMLLGTVADRADLLVVYALASPSDAGIYTVALSIGTLSAYAGSALAGAVFPRAAVFGDRDAAILTATATRVCFMAAAATSLMLVVLMPTLIPHLFGDAYRAAVWPAVVVSLASLASGPQMIVARAAAARNRTHVYVGSYGASTAIMLALDVVLVPGHGPIGAAWASVVASAAGLSYALFGAHRAGILQASELRPRARDIEHVTRLVRDLRNRRPTTPRQY